MYLLKLCLLSLTLTQVCSDFIQTFTGSTGWLRSVTGTSNNLTTLIYTGSWDGYVRKYDYSTGQQLQSFVNTGFVYQVLFSQIYGIFAASQDRAVRQWNNNGQLLNTMWGHRDQVCAVVIIGTFIYSGSADHDIIKWTLPNGNWASTLRGHTGTVWSLATYGNYLFSGAGDNMVMMWNINSNSLINTFVGHTGTVFGLYIGDSYNLFSGARDSTIKRWNIVSGTLVQTLTGHTDKVLALHATQNYLVSGSADRTVRFWSLDTGALVSILSTGHTDVINSVYSEGNYLFTASDDKTARQFLLSCPIGNGLLNTSSGCYPCPVGTFKMDQAFSPCNPCPEFNFQCSSTSLSCLPGYYASLNQCIPCDVGFYKSSTISTDICKPCPIGSSCTTTGIITCNEGWRLGADLKFCVKLNTQEEFSKVIEDSTTYILLGVIIVLLIICASLVWYFNFKQRYTPKSSITTDKKKTPIRQNHNLTLHKQPINNYNVVRPKFNTGNYHEQIRMQNNAKQKLQPNLFVQGNDSNFPSYTSYGSTTVVTETEAIYIPAFLKIIASDYIIGKSIAAGGFGEIFFVTAKPNSELSKLAKNRAMVAKRIASAHSLESSYYDELAIMNIFRDHPNFIQLIAYNDDEKIIITEFYPIGSIISWWKRFQKAPIAHIISLLSGTVIALNEMHRMGLVHNDLKTANVLVAIDQANFPIAKLTDFGLANIVDSTALKVKGYKVKNTRGTTMNYCAPDRMMAQFPNVDASMAKMADIYSIGMVFYAMVTRREPWTSPLTVSSISTGETSMMKTTVRVDANQVLAIPAYMKVKQNVDYVPGKKIAAGGMGEIFMAKIPPQKIATDFLKRLNGRPVIAKVLMRGSMDDLIEEICIMALFENHENFAQLVGFDEKNLTVLMEFYPAGSIFNWIHDDKKAHKLIEIIGVIKGIVKAIAAMHQCGIVHNDLKPANILVHIDRTTKQVIPKLTDFGLANIVDHTVLKVNAYKVKNAMGTTTHYCAPDRFIKQFPSVSAYVAKQSDIYSIGILILEAITRNVPWS